MAPVVAIIPTLIGIAGPALGLTGVAIAALQLATSFIVGALAPKPSVPTFDSALPSFRQKAATRVQSVRTATQTRRVVYGEAVLGGNLTDIIATNSSRFHHMIMTICDGEVDDIQWVWIDDRPVYDDQLAPNGIVNDGRYDGILRIKKHVGTSTQAADPHLVAATSRDSNYQGRGVAYVYLRVEWNQDKFPTGLPDVRVKLRGRKLYDPRDAATRWSPNPALAVRDFLTDTEYGIGATSAEIDDTFVTAAANVCDEMVTVEDQIDTVSLVDDTQDVSPGGYYIETGRAGVFQTGDRVQISTDGTLPSPLLAATNYFIIVEKEDRPMAYRLASSYALAIQGDSIQITTQGTGTHVLTKNAEPRYTCNGVFDTDQPPFSVLEDLLSSMGGSLYYIGGKWRMLAGAYTAPTLTLDESDMIGPMTVVPRTSRRDRFNRVKGVYVSPLNQWQPSDYPPVQSSTYLANDNNEEVWGDIDLPFTSRSQTAQRLAKIALERSRQEIAVQAPFTLKALQLQAGDTVMFSYDRAGWSSKIFEVQTLKLEVIDTDDEAPALGVNLTLRETASTVFDFTSATEETTVDPAPNTDLPDPWTVAAPDNLALAASDLLTATGDELGYMVATFDLHDDYLVQQFGSYEAQFKQSTDANWSPSWSVPGDATETRVGPLEKFVNYDFRMRSVNHLGVRSEFSSITAFQLGTPGSGASSALDYGFWDQSVDVSLDYNQFSDAVSETIDYGAFV